jgi:hypothetical protein
MYPNSDKDPDRARNTAKALRSPLPAVPTAQGRSQRPHFSLRSVVIAIRRPIQGTRTATHTARADPIQG